MQDFTPPKRLPDAETWYLRVQNMFSFNDQCTMLHVLVFAIPEKKPTLLLLGDDSRTDKGLGHRAIRLIESLLASEGSCSSKPKQIVMPNQGFIDGETLGLCLKTHGIELQVAEPTEYDILKPDAPVKPKPKAARKKAAAVTA